MNCWEFMKCGREKGGKNEKELGICPAYPDHGKVCARVSGTCCNGKIDGSFASKLQDCLQCKFYNSPFYDRSYGQQRERKKD